MKRFFSLFQNDWQLLLLFSVPALLITAFGLVQLNMCAGGVFISAEIAKLVCEFLCLGIFLSVLQLIGIKNKWLVGTVMFFYYVTLTADLVLLWYFKERFGAKYVDTLQGGDYNFMTDWRVLSYFAVVFVFSVFTAKKWFVPAARKTAFGRLLLCGAILFVLTFINPLRLLPAPADFYTTYLMPPAPVYTIRAVLAKKPTPVFTEKPDAATAALTQKYNIFSAKDTPVGKNYKRVILIASESLSNKYMNHFNKNIPPQASAPLDNLFENYPSASLKHVSLSTLYGLTVIFTSHPFALLSFNNNYPISFVKELKKNGFHTAFLRGANETYMDENILFQQAGFEKVIGATYFQTRDDYKKFLNWWGLLDRKLFAYAVEYLQENKDKPVFLTVLTLDSHVPLGRLDYLDETYEEIDHKFYKTPTLPRAFARFGQDVQLFLENLEKQGLFDDETLILIMPDHPSYSNTPTNALFKPFNAEFDNLPFIMVTKTKITASVANSPLASQLDIAPTVLDLLNIPQPNGFFGHSLFDTNARRSVFDIKEDYAVITTEEGKQVIPLNSRKQEDKPLLDLMRTFIVPADAPAPAD